MLEQFEPCDVNCEVCLLNKIDSTNACAIHDSNINILFIVCKTMWAISAHAWAC